MVRFINKVKDEYFQKYAAILYRKHLHCFKVHENYFFRIHYLYRTHTKMKKRGTTVRHKALLSKCYHFISFSDDSLLVSYEFAVHDLYYVEV